MELLPLCVCLLTWSETTFADGNDVIKKVVFEDNEAVLPCSFGSENIENQIFDWKKDGQDVFLYDRGRTYGNGLSGQHEQFKGRVEHFQDLLKSGNASIVIRPTKVTDSGNYTCVSVQNGVSTTRSRIELIVGAAPEPSVTSLQTTKDWSLLQCVVRGASPKPEVVWQDSSGHNLTAKEQVTDRGGRYDVTLHTTVTKTGNYTCVATQEEINHWTAAWIHVYISGGIFNTVTIACVIVIGVLFLLVVVLAVILCRRRNRQRGRY
ncbi:CD276 antigen-like isoform X1 [Lates japonicus]|uniref:CD276 antigen-like isoform X1 n=1 Tax=Lates japonicus TaxID=270547 RepID=A0AAD3RMH5_LATJO|nr:CD276 antigen-like isoform X1 [Lates japonicus]